MFFHVPNMKKSLLNVSQLIKDNNVVAEFNKVYSALVLLRGTLKDGLYQLAPAFGHLVKSKDFVVRVPVTVLVSSNKCKRQHLLSPNLSPSVNVAHTNNVWQQWHTKLGHPSSLVLQ